MGWSTSVIAPPDGDMAAYMASLDKLLDRPDEVYWPTHGPAITEPQDYVRTFIAHRREREAGRARDRAGQVDREHGPQGTIDLGAPHQMEEPAENPHRALMLDAE